MAYTVGTHGPGSGPHSPAPRPPAPVRVNRNPNPAYVPPAPQQHLVPGLNISQSAVQNTAHAATHAAAHAGAQALPQTYRRAIVETFLHQQRSVQSAIVKGALRTPNPVGQVVLNVFGKTAQRASQKATRQAINPGGMATGHSVFGAPPIAAPQTQAPQQSLNVGLPPAIRAAVAGVGQAGAAAQKAQAQQAQQKAMPGLPPILTAPSATPQQISRRALAETFLYQPDSIKLAVLKNALTKPTPSGTTILNFIRGVGVDKVIGHSLRDIGPGAAATTPAGYGLVTSGGSKAASGPPPGAPSGNATPGATPNSQKAFFAQTAAKYGLSPQTLWGIYGVETSFGTNTSNSGSGPAGGAKGPMQFEDATWAQYGKGGNVQSLTDAVPAAARYLKSLGATSDPQSPATIAALNAYNGNGGGSNPSTSYAQGVTTQGSTLGPVSARAQAAQAPSGPGGAAYYGLKGKQYKQAAQILERIAGVPLQTHGPGVGPASTLMTGGSGGGYVHPFPAATIGRTDMGVDASGLPNGYPLRAIGDSKVIGIQQNWYNGQPYVAMKFLNGPQQGKYWYIAEGINPSVTAGQTVKAGEPVGHFQNYGNGLEAGFGTATPGQTLAKATTGYSEGQVTPAGQAFRRLLDSLSRK